MTEGQAENILIVLRMVDQNMHCISATEIQCKEADGIKARYSELKSTMDFGTAMLTAKREFLMRTTD